MQETEEVCSSECYVVVDSKRHVISRLVLKL